MKAFYVTVKRDKRTGWLAGPYRAMEEAEARVAQCRQIASSVDPWTDFDAFGVSSIERDKAWFSDFPKGKLNHLLLD